MLLKIMRTGDTVVVVKDDDRPRRRAKSCVACGRPTRIFLFDITDRQVRLMNRNNVFCGIGAAIIHDDQFKIIEGLTPKTAQRVVEVSTLIKGWNNDGDGRQ